MSITSDRREWVVEGPSASLALRANLDDTVTVQIDVGAGQARSRVSLTAEEAASLRQWLIDNIDPA